MISTSDDLAWGFHQGIMSYVRITDWGHVEAKLGCCKKFSRKLVRQKIR
jgi:hypothetical protein